jgi:CubicO group peptidase (beta-lactamase class C family)
MSVFTFIISFMGSASSTAHTSLDFLLQSLPETFELFMEQRGLPSLSVAIVHDQDIIFKRAFGYSDIENEMPAIPETIYRAGSITKLFAATMLMQLVEQGRVGLEDRLDHYIPEYKPITSFSDTLPTTLLQLASHTSGLPVDAGVNFWHYYSSFLWVVLKGQVDMTWYVPKKELLASLHTVNIEHIPNKYSNYSNFGFQLLGMERAAKQSFEEYIQTNILHPLGISSSEFELNNEQRSRFAMDYVYLEPNFDRIIAPDWDLGAATFSGGLYSTPEDLVRFIALQFLDEADEKVDILNKDGIRRLRAPQSVPKPQSTESYGLGWGVYRLEDYQCIEHSGSHFGFFARIEALPELKIGVAIMANAKYSQGYIGPKKRLIRIVLEKFIPVLTIKSSESPFDPSSVDLGRYEGRYEVAGGYAKAAVYVEDHRLYMTFIQQPDFNEQFLPVGPNRFCFASDPEKNLCCCSMRTN